jgi:hypothetical protein
MAQNRSARLITKRTSVPGKIPTGTTGNEGNLIQSGELASNLADHSLWGYDGTDVFEYGSNSFLGLTGGTVSGDVFVNGSLSANTLFSGSTDIEAVIRNLINLDTHTFVQPGSNIITGGTPNQPIINVVDSPSLNNITVSGNSYFQGTTAKTVSVEEYIDFSATTTPSAVSGRTFFDEHNNTLSYYPSTPLMDVKINIGQEGVVYVHNGAGIIITKGQACHIKGVGDDGHPSVELAIASGITSLDDNKFQVSGIASHDIPIGGDGFITTFGAVSGFEVTGATEGDNIYLSDLTAGAFIYSAPTNTLSRASRIGHVIITGATSGKIQVEINNESALTLLSAKQSEILSQNNTSTGILQGGSITNAVTGTTFNVSSGNGYVSNNFNPLSPTFDIVSWGDYSGITSTYVSDTGETHTYILIDEDFNIIQRRGSLVLTSQEKRQNILLGGILHINGQILFSWDRQIPLTNPTNNLEDLTTSIGPFSRSGNLIGSITGSLELIKSLGSAFYFGGNINTNIEDPNILTTNDLSGSTLVYSSGAGVIGLSGSSIDAVNYDPDGLGSIQTIDDNKYVVHRIWHQPTENVLVFQYGQNQFDTLAEAKSKFPTSSFIAPPVLLEESYLTAVIVVKKGITNLDDPNTSAIITQGKFAGTGGGGTTPDTLQSAYSNSTTPEVLTDSVRGALTVIRGSVADTDNVFEIANGAGDIKSFITGNGYLSATTISALSVSADTASAGTNTTQLATTEFVNSTVLMYNIVFND